VKVGEQTTLEALRRGETVVVNGADVKMVDGKIERGNLFVTEGVAGPQLLTAQSVPNSSTGRILARGRSYPYNVSECVKVIKV